MIGPRSTGSHVLDGVEINQATVDAAVEAFIVRFGRESAATMLDWVRRDVGAGVPIEQVEEALERMKP
jgi:hypothetical protein